MEAVNTRMHMKSKRGSFDAAARVLQSGRAKRQNARTSEAQADRGQKLRRSSSSEQRITAQGWGEGEIETAACRGTKRHARREVDGGTWPARGSAMKAGNRAGQRDLLGGSRGGSR
jgi:hypothetical protein